MNRSIFSVIHTHKAAMQRFWHVLAIVLVLASNFSVLVTPAQAQASAPAEKQVLVGTTTSYARTNFSRPAARLGRAPALDPTATATRTPTRTATVTKTPTATPLPKLHVSNISAGCHCSGSDILQNVVTITGQDTGYVTVDFLFSWIVHQSGGQAGVNVNVTNQGPATTVYWSAIGDNASGAQLWQRSFVGTDGTRTGYVDNTFYNLPHTWTDSTITLCTNCWPRNGYYWFDTTTYPGAGTKTVHFFEIFSVNPISATATPTATPTPTTTPAPIPDESVYCKDCSAYSQARGMIGDPIDTHTGNYSLPVDELSVPSAAGPLNFRRTYVSQATGRYTAPLGPGWTHNQDIRLIFPGDPIGEPGYTLFKSPSGNLYRFQNQADGSYQPYPGFVATLTLNANVYTLTDAERNIYTFDQDGRLQYKDNAEGQRLSYSYANNRLDKLSADAGTRYLTFGYDPQGRLTSVTDQIGRHVTYGYDPDSGDLVDATDVLGQTWHYVYDASHDLVDVLDPQNAVQVHNNYLTAGKVQSQYDGNNKLVAALSYNADGSTTITDALGNTRTDSYDPERGVLADQTNLWGGTTGKLYDGNFRPGTITDAAGNSTNLAWSADGANLTSIQDAAGNTTTIHYDGPDPHKPSMVTDPLGGDTTYAYNDPNHPSLLTSVTAGGKTTSYTYTEQGLLETVTDPAGLITKYEYTTHGQRKTVIVNYNTAHGENEAGLYNLTTRYGYDDLGRLTDITPPSGVVTHNEYDAAGKLLKAVQNYDPQRPQNDPSTGSGQAGFWNIVTAYEYDVRGNQIASTDTYGVINRSYYDAAGRVTATIRNLTGQTIETNTAPLRGSAGPRENLRADNYYDDAGNLIATQDERGVITRTYTDRANRTVTVVRNLQGAQISDPNPPAYDPTHPDENVTSRTIYDTNGNAIASVDNAGVVTRTYYDELNRPKRVVQNLIGQSIDTPTFPDNACAVREDAGGRQADSNLCSDSFYDANGNLIASQDPLGVITRSYYDELNRPIRTVQNLVGQSIEATWLPDTSCGQADTTGNVSINLCADNTYDDAGRVIASQDPMGHITRTYYDDAGRAYAVVRNLTGQDISVSQPPAREAGNPDENIRTDTEDDVSGKVLSTTDPLGHITQYEYDLLGRLLKTTANPLADHAQNYQDPLTQDYYNLVSTTSYDALGRALTSTDTLGRVNATEYDNSLGLVLSSTQNVLARYPNNYHNQYNIQTTFSYDDVGQQIAVTDPQGTVTRTYFDALGRTLTSVRNLSGWGIDNVNPPAGQTSAETNLRSDTIYGDNGQVRQIIDQAGKTTAFDYDVLGRRTSVTDPLGHVSSSEYDAGGRLVSSTDAKGVVAHYEYDALGRLTDVWENYQGGAAPDAQTNMHTQYTYDANGERLSIVDGNGHTTLFSYDAAGRQLTETDAIGNTLEYTYDKAGNRLAMLDANGQTTRYTYDSANHLLSILYSLSSVSFSYDPLGRRAGMSDALGQTTWQYDELDRPSSITDPFNKTVGYGYDALGNRTNLTYPDNKQVSYQYDPLGRLKSVLDWNDPRQATQYQYALNGQLAGLRRPGGVITSYGYDDAGRLTGISHGWQASPYSPYHDLASYQYSYDENGNRIRAVEDLRLPATPTPTVTATSTATESPTGTMTLTPTETFTPTPTETATVTPTPTETFTPTPTDTATASATPTPTATSTATNTQTVTPSPTPTSSPAEKVAAQITTVESYVASGEIASQMQGPLVDKLQAAANSLSAGQTNVAINQLNAFNNQVQAQRGKKITTTAADDMIAQVQAVIAQLIPTPTPTRTATATQLAYQPALVLLGSGNLFLAGFHTSKLAQDQSTNTPTPTSTPTATLTPVPSPIPGLEQTIIDYTYDPLNRLTSADYSWDGRPIYGVTYGYSYDAVGNRLSQTTHTKGMGMMSIPVYSTYDDANRLTSVDGVPYTYDNNGNLLDDGVNTYTYDSANRLSNVGINAVNGQVYNISYFYNGLGDRVQEWAGSGQPTYFTLDLASGLTQVLSESGAQLPGSPITYLYGVDRISQMNSTDTQYFLGDALGSVRQMTDASGAVTLAKNYDPYGQTAQSVGAAYSSYGFTGEYQTGSMIYLRSRFYAPGTGRFLTRDTWGGDDNQPISYNKWAYANANPVNLSDPTGNAPIEPCLRHDAWNDIQWQLGGYFDYIGLCIVEKVMSPDPSDYVNTYAAAGVAIESQFYDPWVDTRGSLYYRFGAPDYYHTGLGICNVSGAQMDTVFGQLIDEPGKDNHQLGLGLGGLNQEQPGVAVRAMKRKILAVINNPDPKFKCTKCSVTDTFILAAHAEASNFYIKDINRLQSKEFRLKKNPSGPDGIQFEWMDFFASNNSVDFSTRHIKLFYQDIQELRKRSTDWAVPAGLNWAELQSLSNGIQP